MKAIVYRKYGGPEVLKLEEVEKPVPKENEVLVKIHATSVTAGDWRMRKAEPFIIRAVAGLIKPKKPILGYELSGEVVEVGSRVTRFKVGDKIFGSTGFDPGTYAEFKAVPEDANIEIMPENLSFQEAAAGPIGSLTALYFLRQTTISEGTKILIHGASGSVGTAAVQMAHHMGALVTGVCSTKNVELVKSLGAGKVIDYKEEDFKELNEKFDVIFSTVGKTSFSACKHLLKENGVYLSCAADPSDYFQGMNFFKGKRKLFLGISKPSLSDLNQIQDMMAQGQLKPTIDCEYALSEIQKAHAYVEKGHKSGNVVINVIA